MSDLTNLKTLRNAIAIATLGLGVQAMPAAAADIVIGANQPGSNFYTIGAALSDVISSTSDFTGRLMTSTGAGVWLPMMTTNEVDIGTVSHYEAYLAAKGEGPFTQPFDIGMIAAGSGLNVGLYVLEESGIDSMADIAGKSIGSGYAGSPAIDVFARGELANAGLSYDDMDAQPRSTLYGGQREDVTERRLDVFYASLGSGLISELDSTLGVKFLSLDPSDEAVEKMQSVYPAIVSKVEAGPPGVDEDIFMTYLPSYLVAYGSVSEEAIHATLDALVVHNDTFRAANNALGGWTTDRFVTTDAILPYHPYAVSYYKANDMWSDEMDAHQAALLAQFDRD